MAKATGTKAAEMVLVVGAFLSLGQGLRAEEIAAATGLAEEKVRRALAFIPELPRLSDFYDRGERGWFYDPPKAWPY